MVIEEIRDVALQAASPEIQPTFKQYQKISSAARKATELKAGSNDSEQASSLQEISRDELREAIETLNKGVSILDRRLDFAVDDSTGRLTVKVIDSKTNEVIRESPPERVLSFVRRFREFLGLLVDEIA